jgi:NAD(P)-dependent dehydrogenase (short-subunit alcohol dehydrogenase family)
MLKTVLITGCSRGIGRLTAELFTQRGWNVIATARNPAAAEHGRDLVAMDVTDEQAVARVTEMVMARTGRIDVLINNAGYGLFGPLEGANNGEFERQFQTNVMGTVTMIRQVLPVMRNQKSGVIVNVSSLAGRIANPFMSAYHASKFAIEGLTESLQYELHAHGIRVKLVEPAHFKTDFLTSSLKRLMHPSYDQQFSNYMKWVEKEDATAAEASPVAEAIYKAATDGSDKLRYIVGGGMLLAMMKLLPASIFRELNMQGLTRAPK